MGGGGIRAGGSRRKEKAYGGESGDTDEASVRSRVSYTAKGGGAVYMYEVVRVHVGMCAIEARARVFDCHEQAEQGREKVSALGRMGRTYADDTDVVHLCARFAAAGVG